MRRETITVAPQFVDLVLKYGQKELQGLLPDKVQILFKTVEAAGFEPGQVVPGRLVGDYRDQGGDRTGDTYPINQLCPFKVMNQEGEEDYFAIGWLDCAVRRVVYGLGNRGEDRDELIEAICLEIERSIPLQPIQLTPEGDLLSEYPPQSSMMDSLGYFVKHTRGDHKLESTVGLHEHCNGWMDRQRTTKTHDVIVCRSCHLRIPFPKEIKNYGEFRKAMEDKLLPSPA